MRGAADGRWRLKAEQAEQASLKEVSESDRSKKTGPGIGKEGQRGSVDSVDSVVCDVQELASREVSTHTLAGWWQSVCTLDAVFCDSLRDQPTSKVVKDESRVGLQDWSLSRRSTTLSTGPVKMQYSGGVDLYRWRNLTIAVG